MHRHAVSLCSLYDSWWCCHFSYHGLISLKYDNFTTKTDSAKGMAGEKGISVRETKRWLDAEAYLEEQQQWSSGRVHQEYLCQMMFHHAAATSKHELDCAVYWGRQELSVEPGMEGESTVMELARPDSSWEDIVDLYCTVFQLRRLLGRMLCNKEMQAHIFQEILESVKECLWCKQLSALLGLELRWSPASVPRLDLQADFQARNCAACDRFMDVSWDSCEEALAAARDAHQRVLVAVALLEDKIEKMSHSLSHSCWCSRSCRCSGSHQWRRSQPAYHWTKVLQAASHHGDPARKWDQSPSPSQLRQWVAFTSSSSGSSPKRDTDTSPPHYLEAAPRGILMWKSPICWSGEKRGGQVTNLIGPDQKRKTSSAYLL